MRRVKHRVKRHSQNIIASHVQNNLREYIIASLIFVIGILLGISFINNLSDLQINEVKTYITSSISELKSNAEINTTLILKETLKDNLILVFILWLMGSTVIGLLIVYLIVCFKGFTLGYTISMIVYSLGVGKGIVFLIFSMLLKNIVTIPCIIGLAVSGMKLSKSIMQDRRRDNIKLEILRHTLFCIFILIVLTLITFAEIFMTKLLVKYCIKYI